MTLDKDAEYTRQLDVYLMQRLDKFEATIDEMRVKFSEISEKLNKMSDSQEHDKPFIEAIKSILTASGILKWAISTIVIICAGFATIMTAWEMFQKWLGK